VAPAPAFESATPIYQPPPRVESAPVKPFIEARTPQVSPQVVRKDPAQAFEAATPIYQPPPRVEPPPSAPIKPFIDAKPLPILRRRFATIRSPHSTLRRGSRLRPSSNRRHGNRSRPTSSRTSVPLYDAKPLPFSPIT
jgi:hypothetical protein